MKLLQVDMVAEAREKLREHFEHKDWGRELVPLGDACGRYLAEELRSETDLPEFRRSVVDGYAVVAKDTFGVSDSIPVFLNLVGSVEMGRSCDLRLKPGQTVYVPTGGMLPEGSDAVVMVEYSEKLDDTTIAIYKPVSPNGGIMNVGDDLKKGQPLYRKGHRIEAKDLGMLAAMGKDQVLVCRQPMVTILSTGDEMIPIHQTPEPGQVRDINTHALSAFASQSGAVVHRTGIVKDVYEELVHAVQEALLVSDLVLLSGGSSAGSKDMTADVIDSLGTPGVITHGLAMKPGKPTILGVIRDKLVVGLPGHPMAAIIAYQVMVDHFLKRVCFGNQEEAIATPATLTENIHAGEGRETYQLVTLARSATAWEAAPIHAKSGAISQLMLADGMIRIDALSEGALAGSQVDVILFDR